MFYILLLLITPLYCQYLKPVSNCMANCASCQISYPSKCNTEIPQKICDIGYQYNPQQKQCILKSPLKSNFQVQTFTSVKDFQPLKTKDSTWKQGKVSQCAFINYFGQKRYFQAVGLFKQIHSISKQFQTSQHHQIYIFQFNLIRNNWMKNNDFLIIDIEAENQLLTSHEISYNNRDSLSVNNFLTCENQPVMTQKFNIKISQKGLRTSKIKITLTGFLFNAVWGISNIKFIPGCQKFTVFNKLKSNCDFCNIGYYPEYKQIRTAQKIHNQLNRCKKCSYACTKCLNQRYCSICIKGYKIFRNSCVPDGQFLESKLNQLSNIEQVRCNVMNITYFKNLNGKNLQTTYVIEDAKKMFQRNILSFQFVHNTKFIKHNHSVEVFINEKSIGLINYHNLTNRGYEACNQDSYQRFTIVKLQMPVLNIFGTSKIAFRTQECKSCIFGILNLIIFHNKSSQTIVQEPKIVVQQIPAVIEQPPKQFGKEQIIQAVKAVQFQKKQEVNQKFKQPQIPILKLQKLQQIKSMNQTNKPQEQKSLIYPKEQIKPISEQKKVQEPKIVQIKPISEQKKVQEPKIEQIKPISEQNKVQEPKLTIQPKQETNLQEKSQKKVQTKPFIEQIKSQHVSIKQQVIANNTQNLSQSAKIQQKKNQNNKLSQESKITEEIKVQEPVIQDKKQQKIVVQNQKKDQILNKIHQVGLEPIKIQEPIVQKPKQVIPLEEKKQEPKLQQNQSIIINQSKPIQSSNLIKPQIQNSLTDQKQKFIENVQNNQITRYKQLSVLQKTHIQHLSISKNGNNFFIVKIKLQNQTDIQNKNIVLRLTSNQLDSQGKPYVQQIQKQTNIGQFIDDFPSAKMTNTYFFKINSSLLNPKIDIIDKTQKLQASTSQDNTDDKKSENKNVVSFSVQRLDDLQIKTQQILKIFESFFIIFAWVIIISAFFFSLIGKAFLIQQTLVSIQILFLNVYVFTSYLPASILNSLSGMRRLQNIDFFAISHMKSLENLLFGNMVQDSPLRFTLFHKDINFSRNIIPVVVYLLIILVWYLIVLILHKFFGPKNQVEEDGQIQINFKQSYINANNNQQHYSFLIIVKNQIFNQLIKKKLNYFTQIFKIVSLSILFLCLKQLHNFDYPQNFTGQGFNKFFTIIMFIIYIFLTVGLILFFSQKYFKIQYDKFLQLFNAVYIKKLPKNYLPTEHHRIIYPIIRQTKIFLIAFLIAIFGEYVVPLTVVFILLYVVQIFYSWYFEIYHDSLYFKFQITETIMFCILFLIYFILGLSSNSLLQNSYLAFGYTYMTLSIVLVFNSFAKSFYLIYDHCRKLKCGTQKAILPIQSQRLV